MPKTLVAWMCQLASWAPVQTLANAHRQQCICDGRGRALGRDHTVLERAAPVYLESFFPFDIPGSNLFTSRFYSETPSSLRYGREELVHKGVPRLMM